MYISNNFEFIEHNQITTKDLWKDGVHLTESGKVFLGRHLFFYAIADLETQSLQIWSTSSKF